MTTRATAQRYARHFEGQFAEVWRVHVDAYRPGVNWTDTADALPTGTRTEFTPKPHGKPIGLGFSQDQEYYRVRTQAHLYEPWQVDLAMHELGARATGGLLNFDCHTCGSTVLITEDTQRCPACTTVLS